MRALELKIPPPIVGLLMAALMWLVARSTPSFAFPLPAYLEISGCVVLVGVVTSVLGFASFRRARTTVNPMEPGKASSLVISGIYKRTRNPMYLGLLLVLLGWAIFLSNALTFIFIPAFIFYINRFQIVPEELALASLFGQEFLIYKSRVRRWV